MKRIARKKLELDRQTVRVLAAPDLAAVAGGRPPVSATPCTATLTSLLCTFDC